MAENVVSTGVTSSGITIVNNARWRIEGSALDFNVELNGSMTVVDGGYASNSWIKAGGLLFVSSGGAVENTNLFAGAIINGFTIASQMVMESGVDIIGGVLNAGGAAYLFDGQKASSLFLSSGAILKISAGGSADDIKVSSGAEVMVYDGGMLGKTTMSAGATVNGFTALSTQEMVNFHISSGEATGNATLYTSQKAENISVGSSGNLKISSGGLVSSGVNSGSMDVYSKGSAVVIENYRLLNVFSGGLVNGVTNFAGGSLYLNSYGSASNTVLSNGSMRIDSGATAAGTIVAGGSMIVSAGGKVIDTTMSGGSMIVSGSVENLDMAGGEIHGVASHGSVGISSARVGGGTITMSSGTIRNAEVSSGGRVILAGMLTDGEDIRIYDGGIVSAVNSNHFSNVTVYSGGTLNGFTGQGSNVIAGTLFHSNAIVSSGKASLFDNESATQIIVSSGGSIAIDKDNSASISDVTVSANGSIEVQEKGMLILNGKTTLHDGGGINVSRHIVHYRDEYKNDNPTSSIESSHYSPGEVQVKSATVSSGTVSRNINPYYSPFPGWTTSNVHVIDVGSQGIIRFNFVDADLAANEAMLNNIGLVSMIDTGVSISEARNHDYHDIAHYQFVYSDALLYDTYIIAGGTDNNFSDIFSIVDNAGGTLVNSISVNGPETYAGVTYSLKKTDGYLYMHLYQDDGQDAAITISDSPYGNQGIEPANWTNQDVTITARFSKNTKGYDEGTSFYSKAYSVDGGTTWQQYYDWKGITVESNNTEIVFQAISETGTEIQEIVTVTGIDKTKASITVTPNTTDPVRDKVILNVYAEDVLSGGVRSGYKEGSLQYYIEPNDKSSGWQYNDSLWQTLENDSNLEITENGTVHFRAYDNAGNLTESDYRVSNIRKNPPAAPVLFAKTPEEPTNDVVKLTVNFQDATIKEYSLDGSNWLTYTGPVEISANGDVRFRGSYAGGYTSEVLTVPVTNIDKVAPVKPEVTPDTEDITKQVTLSAVWHEEEHATREYSEDGQNWQTYTGPLTYNANRTVYFRETDQAGNTSDVLTYNISNIAIAEAPEVSQNPTDWTADSVHLTVSAAVGAQVPLTYQYRSMPTDLENGAWSGWQDFTLDAGIYITINSEVEVRAIPTDANEYSSLVSAVSIGNIDKTVPVLISTEWDKDAYANDSVTIAVSASDSQSGIQKAEYKFNDGDWIEFTLTAGTGGVHSGTFDITDNGEFRIRITDKVNNQTESEAYPFNKFDRDNPEIVSADWNSTEWTKDPVTVTVNTSDPNGTVKSGVAKTEYSLDNGTTWTEFTSTDEDADGIFTGTFQIAENTLFKLKVTDKAGNVTVSDSDYEITKIDLTAPSIDDPVWDTAWTKADVTITVTTADQQSGVVKTEYSLDNGSSWTEFTSTDDDSDQVYSGTFTVGQNVDFLIRATDAVGNVAVSEEASSVSNIDKIDPEVTITPETTVVTNQDYKLTMTATDTASEIYAASGIAERYFKQGDAWVVYTEPVTVSENGTYEFKAVDNAGNETVQSITVSNIDKTVPVIESVTQSIDAWTNTNVTLTISASDEGGSEIVSYERWNGSEWTVLVDNTFSAELNGDYKFRVFDGAGNVSAVFTHTVTNIDKIDPEVTITRETTVWTNQDYKLTMTATDTASEIYGASGIAERYFKLGDAWVDYTEPVTVSENGTYEFKAVDNAGNATVQSITVTNIDKIPPVITITQETTVVTNQDYKLTMTATDTASEIYAASGIAGQYFKQDDAWVDYTGPVTVSENGTYEFKAVDNAGNETVQSITVTNIDKIPPVKPEAGADITDATTKPVTVSATFSDDSVQRQYSLNNSLWKNYTGGIVFNQNGTVYFRGIDEAGNISEVESYEVTNIGTSPDQNPSHVVLTVSQSGKYLLHGTYGTITGTATLMSGGRKIATGTLKNGVMSFNKGNPVLLDSSLQTILEINAKSRWTDNTYTATLTSVTLFEPNDGDSFVAPTDKGAVTEPGMLVPQEEKRWVGYGDEFDYYTFTLDNAANLVLHYTATDASKFTLYNTAGKKLMTSSVKATIGGLTTKAKQLEAGQYYLSVQSTNAKKGGSADYTVEVDQDSKFYPEGDHTNDTWQAASAQDPKLPGEEIKGWVGFGDASDFIKFAVEEDGKIQLNLEEGTMNALASKQIKLTCLDENGKSVAIAVVKNDPSIVLSKKDVIAGNYYLGVTCANVKKYDTSYSITTGLLAG